MRALFLLFLVLTAVPLCAQRVWTVDLFNRPGTDFLDLPQAVVAAAPGDVLLLRFTSIPTTPQGPFADYTAPTIDGKGLTIVGQGATQVRVVGPWTVRNVPPGQILCLASLEPVARFDTFGQPVRIDLQMDFTNNRGAIVIDSLRMAASGPTCRPGFLTCMGNITPPRFQDCDLVVLSRSNVMTIGQPWAVIRSNVVMSQSSIRSVANDRVLIVPGTVKLSGSRLWLSGSQIYGRDEVVTPIWRFGGCAPISVCVQAIPSHVHLGPGSLLQGGLDVGSRTDIIAYAGGNPVTSATAVTLHRDPQGILDGFWPQSLDPWIADDLHAQSDLQVNRSGGTLVAQQSARANSLLLLVAGPQAAPWVQLVGPAFVDPTSLVFSDLQLSPATAPYVRSFALPASVPRGTHVLFQAFELTLPPFNDVLTSNPAFFSVW